MAYLGTSGVRCRDDTADEDSGKLFGARSLAVAGKGVYLRKQ